MKSLLVFSLLFFTLNVSAQNPVKWTLTSEKNEKAHTLKFFVDIENEWHVYSQFTPEGGPLPMIFTFDSAACYQLIDKVEEPKPIQEFDSVFAVNTLYLKGKAMLKQKVKVNTTPCKITTRIEYQACKDVCIPMDTTFSITLN